MPSNVSIVDKTQLIVNFWFLVAYFIRRRSCVSLARKVSDYLQQEIKWPNYCCYLETGTEQKTVYWPLTIHSKCALWVLVHSRRNFVCRSFQTNNCSNRKYSWKWETKWTLHAFVVSPLEEEPLKIERARGMYLWQNSSGPKRNVNQTWVIDHYKWGFNDDTVFSR
jgi:hypothetical protein